MRKAVFVGRFQPFHGGHLHAVRDAQREYEVIIVVGSMQEAGTRENPLSYEERVAQIRAHLPGIGIIGVPDVFNDEKWVKSIEGQVSFEVAITGNEWTRRCFEKKGYTVIEPEIYKPEKFTGKKLRGNVV